VAEARWLEVRGCDAIIAQGLEAGGHRGLFLDDRVATQVGTLALVPQVVDAVQVPVIAAGGIGDGRGIAAAFALGASGVQLGTAYLLTPESLISDLHRTALRQATDDATALTNLFSGRPARGVVNRVMREIGPLAPDVPPFPTAGAALAPLKAAAEAAGRSDFSSLWSGQAGALARATGSGELTRRLAEEALARLRQLGA
jgi:nitronate monooxygenase